MKSALLIAGLRADGRTRVIEPIATRDHSERLLRAFGVEILRQGSNVAIEGGQALRGTSLEVPGDFSSAAFFLVLGVLGAQKGLDPAQRRHQPDAHRARSICSRAWARTSAFARRIRRRTRPAAAAEPVADIEVRASKLARDRRARVARRGLHR